MPNLVQAGAAHVVLPPVAQHQTTQAPVAHNLQGIANAQDVRPVFWRPFDAPAAPGPPAVDPVTARDAAQAEAFARFLEQSNPKLAAAMEWVDRKRAGGGADVMSASEESRWFFPYVRAREIGLTDIATKLLVFTHAMFDLSRRGYGRTIGSVQFEAFAQSRELDASQLARYMTRVRRQMPEGGVQLPVVLHTHRDDASDAVRAAHAAMLSDLPEAFLQHLRVVNRTLLVALQWIGSDPTSLPPLMLKPWAELNAVGSSIRNYVQVFRDPGVLTGRGMTTLAYERAAFDCLDRDLPEIESLAVARGLTASRLKRVVTAARERLREARSSST